ncbi:hypothetical protein FBU30_008108 [Linnemannia zychae]|nr:hypothetical protein FBU30_008108 [Linnemannia zychae]
MSADFTPPTQASATFTPVHQAIPEDSATTGSSATGQIANSSPGSAATVKAAMQARRKSRGLGEGLRPDFVFPKPQTAVVSGTEGTTPSGSTSNPNGFFKDHSFSADSAATISSTTPDNHSKPVSLRSLQDDDVATTQSNGTLVPPKNPQQHLKTHYRTHSRNGSTVTVQDLKQAIASVSMDLLELPSITANSTGSSASTTSTATVAETGASGASSTSASGSLAGASSTIAESSLGKVATTTGTSLSSVTITTTITTSTKSKLSTVSVSPDPDPESSPNGNTDFSSLPPLSSFLLSSSISYSQQTFNTSQISAAESTPRGLGLSLDSLKQSSTNSSVKEPLTPLRDSFSYVNPLPSPSLPTRPSSMILPRTARDRSFISVPPFFAYSIPHEFPSPYTSPRLFLPGAAGPTPLPVSPFARKRKYTYQYPTTHYPSSTITVKLPGQSSAVDLSHNLPVKDLSESDQTDCSIDQNDTVEIAEQQHLQESEEKEGEKETICKADDVVAVSALEAPKAKESTATEKRMSWASMVTSDEALALKTSTSVTPAPYQPYRPPGSRLRTAVSGQSATNGQRSSEIPSASVSAVPASTTSTIPTPSTPEQATTTPGRVRKAVPPPLNLVGNSNTADLPDHEADSPTTPTTPSRRRRSRSRKNQKDKHLDGVQIQEHDKESVEDAESLVLSNEKLQSQGEGANNIANGNSDPTSTTDQPKKTRTRSRSRSRSRSRGRAHADSSSSNESVPPVPQTPSWVPAHNMNVASTATPATLSVQIPSVAPSSPVKPSHAVSDVPLSPMTGSIPMSPLTNPSAEAEFKRRGPRPARLLGTRSSHNLHLQTLTEGGQPATFSPRSATNPHPDYFSMRPLQHPPRTPMTPGGEYGDDDDDYYGRLQMVTTPMIQNGFFPNWAKGDAQLEELERIRKFLSARQYPDEMPLSDEWTLFFSDTSRAKDKSQVHDAYSSAITPLFSCHTVPQFATSWKYVRERVRPAAMKVNQNLHWFKKGIKPMWEDPRNKFGGRLTLCPPRAMLDVVWETVLILMAGDVLDYRGESTGAVLARRARGDRVEVWIGADDTPEALAHIRGVLAQELASSGADELVRTAKYKKHFDGKSEEKRKAAAAAKEAASAALAANSGTTAPGTSGLSAPGGSSEKISTSTTPTMSSSSTFSGLSSPLLPSTPRMGGSSFASTNLSEFQTFEAFTQHQQQQQALREREREATKEQERIMQLGKERLEKERAERDRLRDEKVRAMAAAAMAAAEAKHQEKLREQREREAAAAAASQ